MECKEDVTIYFTDGSNMHIEICEIGVKANFAEILPLWGTSQSFLQFNNFYTGETFYFNRSQVKYYTTKPKK